MRHIFPFLALLLCSCAHEFRDALDKAAEASRHRDYSEAAKYLEKAVALQPNSVETRLQLARAYFMDYVPGGTSPGNLALAQKAEDGFRKVLDLAPGDKIALASLGMLKAEVVASLGDGEHRQERLSMLDEATSWLNKLAAVDPQNSEVFYFLGVIDWMKAYPQLMEARGQLHLKPEDPGPLPNEEVRRGLQARIGPIYDDGIRQLTRAVQIAPDYSDAMAYLNLCLREKADLTGNEKDYARMTDEAEGWFQKALKIRKGHPLQEDERTRSSVFPFPLPGPPEPPPPPPLEEMPAGKAPAPK
jgi:tetratricopeptide (TPR) repeat protein